MISEDEEIGAPSAVIEARVRVARDDRARSAPLEARETIALLVDPGALVGAADVDVRDAADGNDTRISGLPAWPLRAGGEWGGRQQERDRQERGERQQGESHVRHR